MEAVTLFLSELNWSAVLQIIAIDILLGGDNAVVIAMACRRLPAWERGRAIFLGVAGAIILRVVLITCAMTLLEIAGLKAAAGALLVWIGVKLLTSEDDAKEVRSEERLLAAVKTIILADFVMSLDNVIGIAGAAQAAAESHQIVLVVFGLLVSIPFIVFGSQIILALFTRVPIIVDLGGALLGWIGASLFVSDAFFADYFALTPTIHYAACATGAALVILIAKVLNGKRA